MRIRNQVIAWRFQGLADINQPLSWPENMDVANVITVSISMPAKIASDASGSRIRNIASWINSIRRRSMNRESEKLSRKWSWTKSEESFSQLRPVHSRTMKPLGNNIVQSLKTRPRRDDGDDKKKNISSISPKGWKKFKGKICHWPSEKSETISSIKWSSVRSQANRTGSSSKN